MKKMENANNQGMDIENTIEEVKIEEVKIEEVKIEEVKIEEVKTEADKIENPQGLPSKMMVTVRFLIGFYLIYTAYGLIKTIVEKEATNQLFNVFFAIVFVIAGIVLLFFSAKSLKTGKYLGGAMDYSIKK